MNNEIFLCVDEELNDSQGLIIAGFRELQEINMANDFYSGRGNSDRGISSICR